MPKREIVHRLQPPSQRAIAFGGTSTALVERWQALPSWFPARPTRGSGSLRHTGWWKPPGDRENPYASIPGALSSWSLWRSEGEFFRLYLYPEWDKPQNPSAWIKDHQRMVHAWGNEAFGNFLARITNVSGVDVRGD